MNIEVGSTWSHELSDGVWEVLRVFRGTIDLKKRGSSIGTSYYRSDFLEEIKKERWWLVDMPAKHPREFRFGIGTMEVSDVAEAATCLHYEALAGFLEHLADRLDNDSNADDERGRHKLAKALFHASLGVREASHCILVASRIKPKKEKRRGKKT
jgi:hypothetical protein